MLTHWRRQASEEEEASFLGWNTRVLTVLCRWMHEEEEDHPSAAEEAGRVFVSEAVQSGSIWKGIGVWIRCVLQFLCACARGCGFDFLNCFFVYV